MKYTVIAVGKLKERFWKDACAEYLKRLGGYAKVEVREVSMRRAIARGHPSSPRFPIARM